MASAVSEAATHPNQPAPGRPLNGRAMSSLISRSAGGPSTHAGRRGADRARSTAGARDRRAWPGIIALRLPVPDFRQVPDAGASAQLAEEVVVPWALAEPRDL